MTQCVTQSTLNTTTAQVLPTGTAPTPHPPQHNPAATRLRCGSLLRHSQRASSPSVSHSASDARQRILPSSAVWYSWLPGDSRCSLGEGQGREGWVHRRRV